LKLCDTKRCEHHAERKNSTNHCEPPKTLFTPWRKVP
jgi:hypothetical protein